MNGKIDQLKAGFDLTKQIENENFAWIFLARAKCKYSTLILL